jgi:hypothetical protein
MQNPISLMEAHQRRIDEMNGALEIGPNGMSIDLLVRFTAIHLSHCQLGCGLQSVVSHSRPRS